MAEDTTPPNDASEGSGTSTDDGARGGTSSDADAFAAERSALNAKVSDFQGRADKAEARASALEARLAALEKTDSTDDPRPLTQADVDRAATQAVFRATELAGAVANLKTEFPKADEAIYGRLGEFESVEALRASVESSHSKVKAAEAAIEERVRGEVLAEVSEKYGIDLGPADPGDSSPTGDPSIEQLNAMSQAELDALEREKPGVIARVSGMPATSYGAWGSS